MITIFHGDDIQAVLTSSYSFIERSKNVIRVDLKRDGVDTLIQTLATDGLFSDMKTVVVINITTLRGKVLEKALLAIASYKKDPHVNVCIVEEGIVTPTILKHFQNVKIELYKLPKFFFTFLDSIAPQKAKTACELLQKLLLDNTAEQLFYSIIKRVRLLLILHTQDPTKYAEIRKMADWQLSKIKQQAQVWDSRKLVDFYNKLYDIEVRMKTSALPLPLASHLDILIRSELI